MSPLRYANESSYVQLVSIPLVNLLAGFLFSLRGLVTGYWKIGNWSLDTSFVGKTKYLKIGRK